MERKPCQFYTVLFASHFLLPYNGIKDLKLYLPTISIQGNIMIAKTATLGILE
ncbi:hypothetical protein D3C81_2133220 [compost metagenome]